MWRLILLLLAVQTKGTEWENLDNMKESFSMVKKFGDEVMTSADTYLNKIVIDLKKFIYNIDSDQMVVSLTNLPQEPDCQASFNIESFKNSFSIQLEQIDLELSRMLHIWYEKCDNVEYSLTSYESLANSHFYACKFKGSDCTESTQNWLNNKLNSLLCEVTSECHNHTISKRNIFFQDCEDGQLRCPDGSCIDRISFDYGLVKCPTHECLGKYDCNPRDSMVVECVDNEQVCDGKVDCRNGNDEEGCIPHKSEELEVVCSENPGEYLCSNKICVGLSVVCDGKDDCGDGSDEGGRCGLGSCDDACAESGGKCFRGPKGPICLTHCPLGTFEFSSECLNRDEMIKKPMEELADDMPNLMRRLQNRYYTLRRKAEEIITHYITKAARCRSKYYNSLNYPFRAINVSSTDETDNN